MLSDRKFGIEIEHLIPGDRAPDVMDHNDSYYEDCTCLDCNPDAYEYEICAVSRNIVRKSGLVVSGTDHGRKENDWVVKEDGSLSHLGCELVSPILSGEDGLRDVGKALDALAESGATVDRSCGLHVHVDAGGLTANAFVRCFEQYCLAEDEIDLWMSEERRGNKANFARSRIDFFPSIKSHFAALTSRGSFTINEFIGTAGLPRYSKINLLSYLKHGTIEFRQHHGTVDKIQAINWIRWCVGFADNCASKKKALNSNPLRAMDPEIIEYFKNRALTAEDEDMA